MRGCPAVMRIVRLRWWSLHLPCLHRTSPCTHPRAYAVSSLAVSIPRYLSSTSRTTQHPTPTLSHHPQLHFGEVLEEVLAHPAEVGRVGLA
jgi:hypothetical protein